MNTDRAEKYRVVFPGYESRRGDQYGCFVVPTTATGPALRIIAAPTDEEWQHVSVSLAHRTPTWAEMCKVKDLFWEPEEIVIQLHPAKSEWISNAKFCLHLWRWQGGQMPMPPSILVGSKELGEL